MAELIDYMLLIFRGRIAVINFIFNETWRQMQGKEKISIAIFGLFESGSSLDAEFSR